MSATRVNEDNDQDLANLNDALEAAGIYAALEVRDGALIVTGEVDSAEMREAALDLSDLVATRRGWRVEDALDVLDIEIESGESPYETSGHAGVFPADAATLTDVGSIDAEQAGEEGVPYFPPTDPVIGEQNIRQDEVEVIGGFQTTSLQGDEDAASAQHFRGDEAITSDVIRELREDALTTDLKIRVHTRNRVVFLVGEVPTLDDAENAEAVAARVPNVAEVREELKVAEFQADRRD